VRQINQAEAAVIRRIFELYADGAGLTRITKVLNDDRVPAPRPQRQRLGRKQRPASPAAPTLSWRDRVEPNPEARRLGPIQTSDEGGR
jgi:hypothetical protein